MLNALLQLKYFTPAIGWGVFITYFTLTPGSGIPSVLLSANDKLLHILIHFFTTSLIYLGAIRYNFKNVIKKKTLGWILVLCMGYGALIELLQHYIVPQRQGDWLDFLANTCGNMLSLLLLSFWHQKSGRSQN